jgi:hypothetical protein
MLLKVFEYLFSEQMSDLGVDLDVLDVLVAEVVGHVFNVNSAAGFSRESLDHGNHVIPRHRGVEACPIQVRAPNQRSLLLLPAMPRFGHFIPAGLQLVVRRLTALRSRGRLAGETPP